MTTAIAVQSAGSARWGALLCMAESLREHNSPVSTSVATWELINVLMVRVESGAIFRGDIMTSYRVARGIVETIVGFAVLSVSMPIIAQQRSESESRGWESSIGLLYQDGAEIGFDGGSFLKADDDVGVIGAVGFNFGSRLDLLFGFESTSVDYELTRQSATTPGLSRQIVGEYDSFTPFVKLNYNFVDRAFTPFISAGVGWSFIDTNIPTGDTFYGCWWDPWWGYVCGGFTETKTVDAFAFQLGVGARWMFNDFYGLRLEYQKQWLDLSRAAGTPSFDQAKLTFVVKYF